MTDFPIAGTTELQVYPTFDFKTNGNNSPQIAAGIEISDGKNPTLWYTFSSQVGLSTSFNYPNGHHVEVLDTPLNQWSVQNINIGEMYRSLGWTVPSSVTLDLFLAVIDPQPGNYSVFFSSIQSADLTQNSQSLQTLPFK